MGARTAALRFAGCLAAATLVATAAGAARADEPAPTVPTIIEIRPPSEAVTGRQVTVLARLTAERGQPVPGQVLELIHSVSFLSVDADAVLATAVTGPEGVATFTFVPGTAGENLITARFAGDGALAPALATQALEVTEGPPSYSETAGIRVPGVGLWLLVAILGAVWGVFLFVMVLLGLIGAEGRRIEAAGGSSDV